MERKMANPFYQKITDGSVNNIRNMYQMFSQAQNPMQLFTNMSVNNPQMKPIMNLLNQGISPETVFKNLCQQKGINPNEFLKKITG